MIRRSLLVVLGPPERMQLDEGLDLLDAKARSGSTPAIIKVVERLLREKERGPAGQRADLAEFGLAPVADLDDRRESG